MEASIKNEYEKLLVENERLKQMIFEYKRRTIPLRIQQSIPKQLIAETKTINGSPLINTIDNMKAELLKEASKHIEMYQRESIDGESIEVEARFMLLRGGE